MLDAGGHPQVAYVTKDIKPTPEGPTVTGGDGSGLGGGTGLYPDGGGGAHDKRDVFLGSPAQLLDNELAQNRADYFGNRLTIESRGPLTEGGRLFW